MTIKFQAIKNILFAQKISFTETKMDLKENMHIYVRVAFAKRFQKNIKCYLKIMYLENKTFELSSANTYNVPVSASVLVEHEIQILKKLKLV